RIYHPRAALVPQRLDACPAAAGGRRPDLERMGDRGAMRALRPGGGRPRPRVRAPMAELRRDAEAGWRVRERRRGSSPPPGRRHPEEPDVAAPDRDGLEPQGGRPGRAPAM